MRKHHLAVGLGVNRTRYFLGDVYRKSFWQKLKEWMMGFVFSDRSKNNLRQVHPDLVRVVLRALQLTEVDFVVTEGARTPKRQEQLVRAGASRTMNSRHIPGEDGYAKAVDLAAIVGGRIRWDWPLYTKLANAMKKAAHELNVPVEWGGDWKSFKDGPHFQLSKRKYP